MSANLKDLKTPWHLRPAASCPPNLSADYSDVFNCEGSTVARVCQENAKGYAAAIVAAPELLDSLESVTQALDYLLWKINSGVLTESTAQPTLVDDFTSRTDAATKLIKKAKGE